ncbi:MAG: transcriptional repressor [Bacteroidales bacterium]|nr:transcriptional repressor [Bacteroidales bacterium]
MAKSFVLIKEFITFAPRRESFSSKNISMKVSNKDIRNTFTEKGLKITPQRVAILEAIYKLDNHPTAEDIIRQIRKNNPNIATGTVYKVLDTLVENHIITKVKTDKDIMRYDGVIDKHHHLYCSECDLIEDYEDEELDELLRNHFKNKNIEGFKMEGIVLQIRGTFDKC